MNVHLENPDFSKILGEPIPVDLFLLPHWNILLFLAVLLQASEKRLVFGLALSLFENSFSKCPPNKNWFLASFKNSDCSRKISFTLDLLSIRLLRMFVLRKYEVVLKTWTNNRKDCSKREHLEAVSLFSLNSWSAASFSSSVMSQSRKKGPNTWITLSWIPWGVPYGLMLIFSYFPIKDLLCNCPK